MKISQTPASILVLSASICVVGGAIRTQNSAYDSFGLMILLAAFGLGVWGVFCLLNGHFHAASASDENIGSDSNIGQGRLHETNGSSRLRAALQSRTLRSSGDLGLSPEIRAQLSLVCHMQGRDPDAIVNELLSEHLPRFTEQNAA